MYIPDDATKITVLVSGGIDSTILLYLLAKEISEQQRDVQINVVSFRSIVENPQRIQDIIKYVEKKWSLTIPYDKSAPSGFIRDVVSSVLLVYKTDYVYTGCNLVVTDKFTPTKYILNDTPPVRGDALNERHIRPFISYDKIKIVQFYLENNLLDLLKMTHSCGLERNEECGECYFCTEKIWATKTLKKNQLFNYTNNVHNI